MKLPTEGELIEMENRADAIDTGVTAIGQRINFLNDHNFNGAPYWLARDKDRLERVAEDFKTLIAIVRDSSELLRTIPDDAALNRELQSLRTSVPEPSPAARPEPKKANR
jgi:hypothetical protein